MEYTDTTKYNLSYYGADYPVDSLVRRMREHEIIVPHFQREYVWKHDEASKFIESLILRLPVPSIFLLRDKETNNLIIIDGQQRLKTLLYFFDEKFPDGKAFLLKGVQKEYDKKLYSQLSLSDQREIRNSIIHCIIIMDEEDSDAPYHIFERLNTTGTPLTSQEIRSALYFGRFNDLIIELSHDKYWQGITYKDIRLTDQEYILRLIAMHYDLHEYNGMMKSFLNQFMMRHRNLESISPDQIKDFFIPTVDLLSGLYPLNNKHFSIAYFEPIFYFISHNLNTGLDKTSIQKVLTKLDNDEIYLKLCKSSTSSKSSVFQRFHHVNRVFDETI